MDEKLEIPEERYMRNTIVIDEMGDSSGFESLSGGEKQDFAEFIYDSHSTNGEPQFWRQEDCMTEIKSTIENLTLPYSVLSVIQSVTYKWPLDQGCLYCECTGKCGLIKGL